MGISTEQEQMLLELLYGEIDAERATSLKSQIDSDPILAARFQSWQSVRTLMADLPEHEPDPQTHYDIVRAARHAVAEESAPSGFFAWLQSLAMAPAAASIGLLVLAGSTLLWMSGRVSEDAAVQPKSASAEASTAEAKSTPEPVAEVEEEAAPKADKAPPPEALGKKAEFGRAVKEGSPAREALPERQTKKAGAKDRAGLIGLDGKGGGQGKAADKVQLDLGDSLGARDEAERASPAKSRAKRSARTKSKRAQDRHQKKRKAPVAPPAEAKVTANKDRDFAPPPPAMEPFAPPPPSAAEPAPVVQADDAAPQVLAEETKVAIGRAARPAAAPQRRSASAGPAKSQVPTSLRQARAAKNRGDLRAAVGFYQSFFNGHRNHPELPRALFEAAESYERLGETPRAIKLYKLLARGHSRYAGRAEMRLNTLKGLQAAKPVAADNFDEADVEAEAPTDEPAQIAPAKD